MTALSTRVSFSWAANSAAETTGMPAAMHWLPDPARVMAGRGTPPMRESMPEAVRMPAQRTMSFLSRPWRMSPSWVRPTPMPGPWARP